MVYSEGDDCPKCNEGILIFPINEDCSCHISPPCDSCIDQKIECEDCGWSEDTDQLRKDKLE